MKIITLNDCIELKERFMKYAKKAEQNEFIKLLMIKTTIDTTIERYRKLTDIPQKEARAMFRAVLKTINEDFSEYEEQN